MATPRVFFVLYVLKPLFIFMYFCGHSLLLTLALRHTPLHSLYKSALPFTG
ncbi:hypothetical protein Abor_015_010 [Acetobacter orientalis]|uniref:Uncharacterized protein n=1 Tax=Acetobacter orientalis TaxID=146474 RepID=A0A2Z5ZKH1_9PROT|nr:hypothetical protein Abor_015_010 [Acetobacter orientalis]